MGCEVYANNDEIACKAGGGKVIAAFPDVCLSPPSPPAGPVPVPYPDTSFSKDMQNGSKTVMIKGQEVMLKDQSFYKTSPLGDEAATNGLGAGVVTHVITGKTYFVSWSMDVQFEGQNVDRHTDMTTSNHASPMANEAAPAPNIAQPAVPQQLSLLCECCNLYPPHSKAQAQGNSITEEEFYGPTRTGPRERTVRGGGKVMEPRDLTDKERVQVGDAQAAVQLTREQCPEQVPNNPPQGPCDKYYRIDQAEKDAIDELYEETNNVTNPKRPAAWIPPPGARTHMIAHRVPRAAGGCPVGAGNTRIVTDPTCAEFDHEFGTHQGHVFEIAGVKRK
jgi:hypothetical protein